MPWPPVCLPLASRFHIQRHLIDGQSVARLVDLGGTIIGFAVEAAEDGAVAITPVIGAPAAQLRLDDGVLPADGVCGSVNAADKGAANAGEVTGSQKLGHVLRQTAPHQIVDPQLDLVIEADRRRLHGMENGSPRGSIA